MQGALFCPPQCPKGTPVLCPHQFFLFSDNGHSQLPSTCSLLLSAALMPVPQGKLLALPWKSTQNPATPITCTG